MNKSLRKYSTLFKITIILLLLLGQFGLTTGRVAAVGSGTISGVVNDSDGIPLTGVSIRVELTRKSDGTGAYSTYTDPADGTYTITGVLFEEELALGVSCEDPDVDGYTCTYYDNAGSYDWGVTLMTTEAVPDVTGIEVNLESHRDVILEHLTFNTRAGRILQDINVRAAIAYGTDREYILNNAWGALGTFGQVMNNMVYPGVWYEAAADDPNLYVYPYEPTRAESILTAIGWVDVDADGIREKGGNELSLDFITTDATGRVNAAAYFQTMMADIGIQVKVTTYPYMDFFADTGPLITGDFDIAQFAWGMSDFDYLIGVYRTGDVQNWGGFENASLDEKWTLAHDAREADSEGQFYSYALSWQYAFSKYLPALPMFTRISPAISGTVMDGAGNPLTGISVPVDIRRKADETLVTTVYSSSDDGTFSAAGMPLEEELYVCASMEDPDTDGIIGECYNNVTLSTWSVGIWLTLDNPNAAGVDLWLNDHGTPYYMEQFTFNTNPGRILELSTMRQAIAWGTDRQALLENAWEPYGTTGEILDVMMYPDEWYAVDPASPYLTTYDYNPTLAMIYLENEGWTDSNGDGIRDQHGNDLVLEFYTRNTIERETTAGLFKDQMALIGVGVNITTFPDLTFLSSTEYDIAEFAWGWGFGYDELPSIYQTGDIQNYGGYSNVNLDSYYYAAMEAKASNDTAYFLSNAQEWQFEFSAQLPALPLFSREPLVLPVISGTIRNKGSLTPFTTAEVLMSVRDETGTEIITSYSNMADGGYAIVVPMNFTGTITPILSGYWFGPVNWNYSNVTSDLTGEDYTAVAFYPLTVSKAGTGSGSVGSLPSGISCGEDCTNNYESGTSVKLTATASAGSAFTGWSGACGGMSTICYVTMSKAKSVTATFTANPPGQYYLAVVKSGSGSITSAPAGISCPSDCGEFYTSGTSVTLTATASAGYVFTGWSGACGGTTTTCFVTMSKNKNVTATFLAVPAGKYYLGVKKAGSGTVVSVNYPGISCGTDCAEFYNSGLTIRLKATPAAGYVVTWSGACGGSSLNCYVTMSTHKFVKATFTFTAFLEDWLRTLARNPLLFWRGN